MVDLLKISRKLLRSRMTHISWMIRTFLRLFSAVMWMTCGEGMRMIAARGMKISEKLTIAGHKHVVPSEPLRNCNFFEQRTAWRRGIVCFYHEGENDVTVYWTSRSCQCFRGEKQRSGGVNYNRISPEFFASWSQQLFTNSPTPIPVNCILIGWLKETRSLTPISIFNIHH